MDKNQMTTWLRLKNILNLESKDHSQITSKHKRSSGHVSNMTGGKHQSNPTNPKNVENSKSLRETQEISRSLHEFTNQPWSAPVKSKTTAQPNLSKQIQKVLKAGSLLRYGNPAIATLRLLKPTSTAGPKLDQPKPGEIPTFGRTQPKRKIEPTPRQPPRRNPTKPPGTSPWRRGPVKPPKKPEEIPGPVRPKEPMPWEQPIPVTPSHVPTVPETPPKPTPTPTPVPGTPPVPKPTPEPTPKPTPTPRPTPEPTPKPELKPAPAPAPKPELKPAPQLKPAPKPIIIPPKKRRVIPPPPGRDILPFKKWKKFFLGKPSARFGPYYSASPNLLKQPQGGGRDVTNR